MNSYERLNFVNGQPPLLNDVNLNHIDKGIADAFENTEENKASIIDLTTKNEQNTTDIVTIKANEKTFEKSIDLGTVTSLQTLINYTSTGTIYTGTIAFSAEFTGSFVMWIVQTKRFLLCSDGTLWGFDNPTTTTATKVTYSVDDVNKALAKKQDTLMLDSTPTIGSTNFVNSDRIAAALSYKANGKDLSKKADKTDVDSALNLKADKTSVDDNFATKENLINKVNTIDSSITDVNKYPSVTALLNYLSEFYYDFEETNDLLSKKYDSANIESGTSVLTPHSSSVGKFKENSCIYEKIGNMCFYNVTVILNAATMATASTCSLPLTVFI